jgi:outer membrane receptor protein involved in Fe transport
MDLAAQWNSSASSGPFRGAGLLVSVINLFNERPASTRSRNAGDPSYDSTNYPATGRAISFTLTKAW